MFCNLALLAPLLQNVKTTCEGMLVLVKFAKDKTPPQLSFAFYNETDNRKLRNTSHMKNKLMNILMIESSTLNVFMANNFKTLQNLK